MSLVDQQVRAAEQEFLDLFIRGPVEARWSQLPVQVGDPAPDPRLSDSTGAQRALSEFWTDRPALLLFWRHYGCSCGAERAARLHTELGDYLAAGANVTVIGQAEPERSAAWTKQYEIECPVLCDPDYRAYRSFGLVEGQVSQILFDAPQEFWGHTPEVAKQLANARRQQGRPLVDHPWLLPGEFVVDRRGIIRLAYRYQYCEDYPNPLVLTTAIKTAAP